MPIIDKFKDMGTTVMGKVESGTVREGDSLLVMPNKVLTTKLVYLFLTTFTFFLQFAAFCLTMGIGDFNERTDSGESCCCFV